MFRQASNCRRSEESYYLPSPSAPSGQSFFFYCTNTVLGSFRTSETIRPMTQRNISETKYLLPLCFIERDSASIVGNLLKINSHFFMFFGVILCFIAVISYLLGNKQYTEHVIPMLVAVYRFKLIRSILTAIKYPGLLSPKPSRHHVLFITRRPEIDTTLVQPEPCFIIYCSIAQCFYFLCLLLMMVPWSAKTCRDNLKSKFVYF